jgi:hypothetical protein
VAQMRAVYPNYINKREMRYGKNDNNDDNTAMRMINSTMWYIHHIQCMQTQAQALY